MVLRSESNICLFVSVCLSVCLSVCPAPSQGAVTREFMLALQWINFNHQASDLQFFFSEPLYNKVAELSCVPSTEVTVLPSLPSTKLWEGLKTACALMMQSLAMQIRYVPGNFSSWLFCFFIMFFCTEN